MDGYVQSPQRDTLTKLTTPTGIGSSLGIALSEASAAGAVWSLVIAAAFTGIISAGLAELASAYPIAGAQYYWACKYARNPNETEADQHRASSYGVKS